MVATGSRTLKLSILADVDNLKKSLDVGSKDVDGFAGKIGDFSKKAALAFAAVAAAAGAMAIKIGVDAVKAASDLSETISKVGVLFGDTADDIEKFADGAASSLGQTKQQALDAAATFATFGKAAGLSGQDLSKFSIDFVTLASDLASFNNTSPEQAINAIGSALRGEAEPLRAYGVLLDDASLRQAALELNIVSTTKNALTPQQKVLAAQALIYKQTSAAQGDFERTSDGLANKTKILTAQLENAKTEIGTALLPIVLQLATAFSDKVIPLVEKFTQAFSNTDGNLGGVVSNVGNILKNTLTPIIDGLDSAFRGINNVINNNKENFESFYEVVKRVAPLIGQIIGGAIKVLTPIAETVLSLFARILGAIKPMLNTAIDGINLVIRGLNLVKVGKDIPYIGKIGATSITTGFSGTTPGGQSFSGNLSGDVGDEVVTRQTIDLSKDPANIAKYSTNAADRAAAQKIIDAMTFNIGGLNDAANTARTMSDLGSGVAAGLGTSGAFDNKGTTINLNVTGAIDSEGTARTIVDTLNNSFYRGTNGATNLVFAT
jgi:hypothetical protein